MRIDAPIITGSFSLNGDALIDLNVLTTTGSNTFIGNQSIIGAISASALTGSIDFTNLTNSPTLVSGSSQVIDILSSLNTTTASFTPRISNLESKSSSVDISITNINSVTASNIARLTNLESKSASVDISITNINSYTSSQDTKNTTLGSYTGSNDTKWTSIGNLTGSYATTGSNTFFGTQTYSGSVYIANDLIVQGSSSIQYISASSVSIGTNIVQLNTANPSVRFAGLTIIDSGSVGGSGSFLYDSVQDEFIFVHRGNGTNITSSHFVLGPETYDSLGNETYLTSNIIPKGTGKEHLIDSSIFDNGTTVCVNSTLKASGQVCSLMGNFGCIGIGTTSPKTYASLTSCGQIISLNNIGIDVGQSYRLNNYYNAGTGTDRTISSGFAASIGLDNTTGGMTFNISSTCVTTDNNISTTEIMRIMCNGYLGIGTTTPSALLHLCSISSGVPIMRIQNSSGTGYSSITFHNSSNTTSAHVGYGNSGVACPLTSAAFFGTIAANDVVITATDTERIRITSNGITTFTCQVCVTNNLVITGAGMFINRPAVSSGEPYIFWQKDGVTRASIYGADGTAGLRYFSDVNIFYGNVVPDGNNTRNLGSTTCGWANIYTNDFHLSNMNKCGGNDIDGTNGNWTIQEGICDLYIINNNTCEKYKFNLTKI